MRSSSADALGSECAALPLGAILPGVLCNDCVLKLVDEPRSPNCPSPVRRHSGDGGGDIELGLGMSGSEEKATEEKMPEPDQGQRHHSKRKLSSRNLLEERDFTVSGDPTEACLVSLAVRVLNNSPGAVKVLQAECARQDAIPFDSSTKYMATLQYVRAEHLLSMADVVAGKSGVQGASVAAAAVPPQHSRECRNNDHYRKGSSSLLVFALLRVLLLQMSWSKWCW